MRWSFEELFACSTMYLVWDVDTSCMLHKIFEYEDPLKDIFILWTLYNLIKFGCPVMLQLHFKTYSSEYSQCKNFFFYAEQFSNQIIFHPHFLNFSMTIFMYSNWIPTNFSFTKLFLIYSHFYILVILHGNMFESLLIHTKYVWLSFIHSFTNILVLFLPYLLNLTY